MGGRHSTPTPVPVPVSDPVSPVDSMSQIMENASKIPILYNIFN